MNRARVKKRHDVPLTAEMLNELNKAHMAGIDGPYDMGSLYDMEDIWNEKFDRKVAKVREDMIAVVDGSFWLLSIVLELLFILILMWLLL